MEHRWFADVGPSSWRQGRRDRRFDPWHIHSPRFARAGVARVLRPAPPPASTCPPGFCYPGRLVPGRYLWNVHQRLLGVVFLLAVAGPSGAPAAWAVDSPALDITGLGSGRD